MHELGRSQVGVIEDKHDAALIVAGEDPLRDWFELVGLEHRRRQPYELTLVVLVPFLEQARLAVPRRGDDHRERRVPSARETTDERGAPDESRTGRTGAPSGAARGFRMRGPALARRPFAECCGCCGGRHGTKGG